MQIRAGGAAKVDPWHDFQTRFAVGSFFGRMIPVFWSLFIRHEDQPSGPLLVLNFSKSREKHGPQGLEKKVGSFLEAAAR